MFSRRALLSLSAVAALAACNGITEIDRSQPDTGPLRLNAVNVDFGNTNFEIEGRPINKTTAELQNDLRDAIAVEAQKRSIPDGLPANIDVKVERIKLASTVDRVLAGTSFLESEISVVEAETGALIVAPVGVKATADQLRGPGVIGAATAVTTTADSDYQNLINAYARTLLASLDASR